MVLPSDWLDAQRRGGKEAPRCWALGMESKVVLTKIRGSRSLTGQSDSLYLNCLEKQCGLCSTSVFLLKSVILVHAWQRVITGLVSIKHSKCWVTDELLEGNISCAVTYASALCWVQRLSLETCIWLPLDFAPLWLCFVFFHYNKSQPWVQLYAESSQQITEPRGGLGDPQH